MPFSRKLFKTVSAISFGEKLFHDIDDFFPNINSHKVANPDPEKGMGESITGDLNGRLQKSLICG